MEVDMFDVIQSSNVDSMINPAPKPCTVISVGFGDGIFRVCWDMTIGGGGLPR